MLLAIVIAKSLIELSLMFIIGRFLLGLLAGANLLRMKRLNPCRKILFTHVLKGFKSD